LVAVARVSESACCARGALPCLGDGKAGGRGMGWVEGGSRGGGEGKSSLDGACNQQSSNMNGSQHDMCVIGRRKGTAILACACRFSSL